MFDDEGTYVSQAWAVDNMHALAPYTYWYDHPPLGWIMLAGWTDIIPAFTAHTSAIIAARWFMLVVFVASCWCLYSVARRLGLSRAACAVAVVLFGLSPLAVHCRRMVLLDNLAVVWLLAGFALALSQRRHLFTFACSGVCMALACLTKETFLLFVPALALLVWQRADGPTPSLRDLAVSRVVDPGCVVLRTFRRAPR